MLLKSQREYYEALIKIASKYEHGIVTSFGVFCGITFDFDCSKTMVSYDRKFLDTVSNHNDLTIIVGTGGYYSPKKSKCNDCLAAFSKRNIRIEKHRELFPNINWRFLENLHSKVAVFWGSAGSMAIIGSRNLTGSDNMEVAVVVKDRETTNELLAYCSELVSRSEEVNLDNLIIHNIEQTGGDDCIKLLYDEV
jgi:hypothetical protein